MEIYVKISLFSYFLFPVFKHDLSRCIDFTRIAAPNTASDDVTNQVTHRVSNIDLLYYCDHFVVVTDEKSSQNGGFLYDFMMLSDSGLLFGSPCISSDVSYSERGELRVVVVVCGFDKYEPINSNRVVLNSSN